MPAPTLTANGDRGGTAANDPRWKLEEELGRIQTRLVEIRQAQRVIEAYALYPDPLDWPGAFDRIFSEVQIISRATDELHQIISDRWVELIEAIRSKTL